MKTCLFCKNNLFEGMVSFTGTTKQYLKDKFIYGWCNACGSVCNLSINDPDYTNYVTGKSISFIKVKRLVNLFIRLKVKKRDSILDYGCGNGALVNSLGEQGYSVDGYEPHSDEWNTPLRKKYNVVLLTHVFEHISDYKLFFSHLDSLTVAGSLVISIHPSSSRISKLDSNCPFQCWAIHAPFHLSIPSDKATNKIFQKNGFLLKKHFPYDIQRSGFKDNNNVSALLFKYLGKNKENLLRASRKKKLFTAIYHPISLIDKMLFRIKDKYTSTFVYIKNSTSSKF
jgi:hypothetical protein